MDPGGILILNDLSIIRARGAGDIEIDPWDQTQLNPASYDLTLGEHVTVYDFPVIHDVRERPSRLRRAVIDPEGFVIHPGKGYLMHTRERIATTRYVPVLDGKSSIGRLFISVHQTAGYGDPGFNGQFTLEVTTLYSIRLYAGMRIAQLRFHELSSPVAKPYKGNYVDGDARGPVASKAWKQFGPRDSPGDPYLQTGCRCVIIANDNTAGDYCPVHPEEWHR